MSLFTNRILIAAAVAHAAVVRYDGHRVLRVVPTDSLQVQALRDLAETGTFDFWTEASAPTKPVDIHCSPVTCETLLVTTHELGISNHSWMITDMQQDLDNMLVNNFSASADFALDQYHTIEEIEVYLASLAAQYSGICEYVKIGTSYEGRDLGGIKITGTKRSRSKKAFFMNGGIHAREWISPATTLYMLTKTLEGYGSDMTVTNIVDNMNIYYVPVLNPDGYSYTWKTNRMHRKTTMPSGCSRSPGTDPNRNWDFQWGLTGVSTNPCSDVYLGKAPADQSEVKATQDYLCGRDDFIGYIDIHAYSQLWMSPWGYTYSTPSDYAVQNAGSKAAVDALSAVHGTRYKYGPIASTIYPAAGSSADYAYGVCGVRFSYAVELRDTGRYGFLLPASQIIPSGEETFEAVKALAQYMITSGATVVV